MLIEKNKLANVHKENDTLKTTLKNREDYISGLRTEDEIKEMEENVTNFVFFRKQNFIVFFASSFNDNIQRKPN